MVEVAIFGDTHVPSRAPAIPDWVWDRVQRADYVVSVGDYDSQETVASVESRANNLTAVRGNMDPSEIDLPTVATLDVDGVRFVVTHGTGVPDRWADTVASTAREHADDRTTVGVGGHIHEVVDEVHEGVRLLNPGSATGAAPADEATMLVVEVDDGIDVEVLRE
jgi:putative phosphoesterase